MKVINRVKFEATERHNRRDPRGQQVVQLATAWADLLEDNLANGVSIPDAAASTLEAAKRTIPNVDPHMVHMAVVYLNDVWEHGAVLKEWNIERVEAAVRAL